MSSRSLMMGSIRCARASSSKVVRIQVRYATTAMRMPAMSPTMTEGGITSWKKQEGEKFSAGDVLLEVETDKATIDVEAQDDGVMGKIVAQAGTSKIPVGQIIAMLAEEGDDLSAIEVPSDLGPEGSSSSQSAPSEAPKTEPASSSSSQPSASSESSESSSKAQDTSPKKVEHKDLKYDKPLFPSVSRLLLESSLTPEQISNIKGTGRHGMLTKGDVLVAMGQIKSPYASAEKLSTDPLGPSGKRKSESKQSSKEAAPVKEEPLDGPSLRRLILGGMAQATKPSRPIIEHVSNPLPRSNDHDFDALLAPYASLLPPPQPEISFPSRAELAATEGHEVQTKKDEWAGLM